MLRLVLICFCFFLSNYGIGQLTYSLDDDSAFVSRLERETSLLADDSAKAYNYLRLSLFNKLIGDTVKAKAYLEKGSQLGQKNRFLRGAAFYYRSHAYYGKPDLNFLIQCYLQTDSILSKLQSTDAFTVLASSWHNYGIVQQMKGNEKEAMNLFTTKSLPYAKKSGDMGVLGKVYKAIGIVYMNANDRAKADEYLQKSIEYLEKPNPGSPTQIEELVDAYITAAENNAYRDLPEKAKPFLDKAEIILGPHPTSNLYLRYYFALGEYFNKVKDFRKAIVVFEKGIGLTNDARSQFSINRLKLGKYNSLMSLKDYSSAVKVVEELLSSPYLVETDRVKYYKELYTTYLLLGNNDKAITWANKYITLNDSLQEVGLQRSILELERKYNDAENKRQIEQLQFEKDKALYTSKNNRLLNWVLGLACIIFITFLLFGLVYYRNSQKLAKRRIYEAEQRQKAEFVKAFLEGEEKERKRLAGDLHDGLGGMLAGIKLQLSRISERQAGNEAKAELGKIVDHLSSSIVELRRIAHDLIPESLLQLGLEQALADVCEEMKNSTGINIEFKAINLHSNIRGDIQVTTYRIVQELVHNAVKHSNATEVFVQCSQSDSTFYLTVEDNGKGFDIEKIDQTKGIGFSNIRRRIDLLHGKMDIRSETGSGTEINIEFNVFEN